MEQAGRAAIATAGGEFARRFLGMMDRLKLTPGIHYRAERLMKEFGENNAHLRGHYLSRSADPRYFADGEFGWEAAARPQLHGLAISGDQLYEFVAFANGFRRHVTPLDTVIGIDEIWLETAPNEPFAYQASLTHSFPSVTGLYALESDSQESALDFIERVKYLKGW